MNILFHDGGSAGFELGGPALSRADEERIISNAARLLDARRHPSAAALLRRYPWRIVRGNNFFSDEFSVLTASLPIQAYEEVRCAGEGPEGRAQAKNIARIVSELGVYIRFVAVELALAPTVELTPEQMSRVLQHEEIHTLVYDYIGVAQGYLGDFSYESHRKFYADLKLKINPYDYTGTTRERFTRILEESAPEIQATILDGILARYPVGSSETRTAELAAALRRWIDRLRGGGPVPAPKVTVTSAVVLRALSDAETLLGTNGAQSAVDRLHTAFHGYLRHICKAEGIEASEDATISALLNLIREKHPAFAGPITRGDDVRRILRAMSAIADALNPVRNRASVAHPNDDLLDPPEALLVVNTVRSLLTYLDSRIGAMTV